MNIADDFKGKVANLARKHRLFCVVLFGSQATGKANKFSDTDMAFLASRDINLGERIEIASDFEKTLRIKELELVDARAVAPIFMKQIADKGRLLYEDNPGRFTAYKIYAFKMYVDTAPLRQMRESFLNRFIAKYA